MTAALHGMAWDHPRARAPLEAVSAEWSQRTGIAVRWDARPLKDFEDQPLEELASRYDLLLIDYPFVETAATSGLIVAVEDWVDPAYLRDQAAHSVGPSYASYTWADRQWALAIDAACQVSAVRTDLWQSIGLADLPRDWAQVARLAAQRRSRVAMPLNPNHAYCAFLSVGVSLAGPGFWRAGRHIGRAEALEALEFLRALTADLHAVSRHADPIAVSDLMAGTDEVLYVPLMFGYSSYARPGFRQRTLRFSNAPHGRSRVPGSVLGGVGLALSSRSTLREPAADLARTIASPFVQAGLYARSGGQPGHDAAWASPELDALLGGFFTGTRETMNHAFMRPRVAGHRRFQPLAGELIHEYLWTGAMSARECVARFEALIETWLPEWHGLAAPVLERQGAEMPQTGSDSSETIAREGPLEGLRVLDFTALLQGPLATQVLADLGADVVKLEKPDGEWMRQWGIFASRTHGETDAFLAFNRNKRSVEVDLRDPGDLERILELVDRADVVVENFRPGVMDRAGLGYDTLRQRNPRLIYAASSGYGRTGPYVKRPGQDYLLQALTGAMWLGGRRRDPPFLMPLAVTDHYTGLHLVVGILAALEHRHRTGEGQRVDVDLLSCILALQQQELTVYLNQHNDFERAEENVGHPGITAPCGVYATQDGYLLLAMSPCPKLGQVLGVDWLAEFDTTEKMYAARDTVHRLLARHFATLPTSHWMELLTANDVWCAPVRTYADLESDPQVLHKGLIWDVPYADSQRSYRTVGSPFTFSAGTASVRRGAPRSGQHNEEFRAGRIWKD